MSPLHLIGLALIGLGILLHIVGISTLYWSKADEASSTHFGLFKGKLFGRNLDIDNPNSSLEATRAMCIIGLLLAMGSAALCVFSLLIERLRSIKLVPLLWFCIAAGACGTIVVGCIIYAAEVMDEDKVSLGYSFALSIVGAFVIGGGGLLSFFGARQAN